MKTPILLAAVAAAVLLLAGCESQILQGKSIRSIIDGSSITLDFLINETGRPLDGSVLLGKQLLGTTENGTITLDRKGLAPGILTLAGRDKESGSDFEFRFAFDSDDISIGRISFQVTEKGYEDEIFDASKLDAGRVETEIFNLANEERAKASINSLRRDGRVAGVARAYSEVLSDEGFHHTDTEGKDVKDRLNEAGIVFLVAAENLFSSSSMTAQTNLAREAIDGWLKSPGHRATLLDRDGIYSDAGVGVYCTRKDCFVVMNFAALRQEQKASLNKGWVTFHYLNNPGYNFAAGTVPVKLELSATSPVNAYIVPSYASYKDFTDGKDIATLREFKGTLNIDATIDAVTGTGIIIEAASGDSDVGFSIDYSP